MSYADQMTEALRIKTVILEKSNNDLEQFAYIASHDLKSPLNAIYKLVGWIEEDIGDEVSEDTKNHLQLLRGRSNRMKKLLDDLLSYARVGRMGYDTESIQLKQVSDAIFELQDKPEQFSIKAQDVQLELPRVPFELVLRNLISNALKHHDRNSGVIEVSCEHQDGNYQIRIQDDGPGIPPDLHQKALEMFHTLQPRDVTEGSGMGLSLVNKIVEHYGGEFRIESDGTRGTAMIVIWPVPTQDI